MIKLTAIFTLVLLSLTSWCQEQEILINTPVENVIVYLDGAEISQKKTVNLNPGRTKVIFSGISSKLISKSVQVTTTGEANLLAISDKLDFTKINKDSPRIKSIKDSIKLIQDQVMMWQQEEDAYNTEKKMLITNQSIGGNDKGVAIAELKLAADFFRSRVKEINSEVYRLQKKITVNNEIYNRLNNALYEENGQSDLPFAEITVLLTAANKTTTTLELKYLVSDAGWAPSYDLKADDINKPIELIYRAKVFNNTDIDWKNVKLRLSTADPMKSASQPKLNSWYLNFSSSFSQNEYNNNNNNIAGYYQQQANPVAKSSMAEQNSLNNSSYTWDAKKPDQKNQVTAPVAFEEIQISELSAEFDIKSEYTIPSDAKPYIVEVTAYNLPATFKYYSVPKVERNAFMLARISGWEDLELVEGPANVYLGGTFVGQSYIYTRSTNDTLDLSVGRDNKIMVSRTKLKDFNKEKVVGNNRKVTYAYEIAVKNNRKSPITIDIEDQLPVSQSSEITVETIEISKADYDPLTGKLLWTYTIQPGETVKLNLSFSVKYPRNKNIDLEKKVKRARAKF